MDRIQQLISEAVLHEAGVERPYDCEAALKCWRMAASLGSPWAIKRMRELESRPEFTDYFTEEDFDILNGKAQKSILIADDDTAIRQEIANLISNFNFKVKLAADGTEALRILKEEVVHGAILDIKMPGKDGFEILDHLKSEQSNIPVIVCTGYANQSNIARLKNYKVGRLFPKPFYPEEITQTLKDLFG